MAGEVPRSSVDSNEDATPKIATQSQWENLVSRIKAKQDTLTSGDITTDLIADSAVTQAKLASGVPNRFHIYGTNLAPSEDTPSGWGALLPNGGGSDTVIWYDTASTFASQPNQYGFLETIVRSGSEVYQRWTSIAYGPTYERTGNGTGWNNSSSVSGSGAWRRIITTGDSGTVTASNINWGTLESNSTGRSGRITLGIYTLQWGIGTVSSSNGRLSVTFGTSYSSIPTVFCTTHYQEAANSGWPCWVYARSTTGCTIQTKWVSGGSTGFASAEVQWLAIGYTG